MNSRNMGGSINLSGSIVIHRNNEAVSLIETGKYKEAILCLSYCLRVHSSEKRDTTDQSDIRPESTPKTSLDRCMLQSQQLPVPIHKGDETYVYEQPIRLPPNIELCCKGRNMIGPVLLFNLGLAYHLLSHNYDSSTEAGEPNLRKALMLYDLALTSQSSEAFFDSNYMFVLAILNNSALIHRHRNEGSQARMSFEQILSILMFMVDRGAPNNVALLDGFYYNISFLGEFFPLGAATA